MASEILHLLELENHNKKMTNLAIAISSVLTDPEIKNIGIKLTKLVLITVK